MTLRPHGEAVAMHGMSEAVYARSNDGPSTEDVRAGVSAGEATEAGAGATTPRSGGLPRRCARAAGGAPRPAAGGCVRMSRAGLGADPVGVAGQSTPDRGQGRAPVTRRLRPRSTRNDEGIGRNVGGGGPLSRAGFASQATVITVESVPKLGAHHAPASRREGLACSDDGRDHAPRATADGEHRRAG